MLNNLNFSCTTLTTDSSQTANARVQVGAAPVEKYPSELIILLYYIYILYE